eukprot:4458320-Pleurochrysis_carterae.AAC.3
MHHSKNHHLKRFGLGFRRSGSQSLRFGLEDGFSLWRRLTIRVSQWPCLLKTRVRLSVRTALASCVTTVSTCRMRTSTSMSPRREVHGVSPLPSCGMPNPRTRTLVPPAIVVKGSRTRARWPQMVGAVRPARSHARNGWQ